MGRGVGIGGGDENCGGGRRLPAAAAGGGGGGYRLPAAWHHPDQGGHGLLVHDCAGGAGTSGAPLLQLGGDGIWRAIGVQVAEHPKKRESYAVPAATLEAVIR